MARTVLLADDSVTAQNMGRRILIDAGYEVITVNNGSAALKKIHENRPDLIVLDVYMPGYGGLEVCQRLKESSETSRIPILLTVGKMEPFKPDEARKVRADGHIIKPFDAGELLAALAKLEDRIVPQPELSRGRKGKSEKKSRPWQVADPAMTFDDSQTDKIAYLAEVKQRHRSGEPADNGSESAATVDRESTPAGTDSLTGAEAAERLPATLRDGLKMARPMSVYAAEQLQELPVVAEPASASASQDVAAQQEPTLSQSALSEPKIESAEAQAVTTEQQAPASASQEVAAQPDLAVSQDTLSEPTSESAEAEAVTTEDPAPISAVPETVQVTEPEEAAPEPTLSSSQAQANVVSTASAPISEGASAQAEPQAMLRAEEAGEPVQNAAATRWTAENAAVTPEEASLELDREMQEAQARAAAPEMPQEPAAEATSAPDSPQTDDTNDETNGATFAAAASASSGTSGVGVTEIPAEPPVAPETAAAWENWQHIRDSVMGSQTAISISESVAQVVQASVAESRADATQQSAPAEIKESAEAPAEADSEAADLSRIVDSVLAELKPKLMAEISKKLKK